MEARDMTIEQKISELRKEYIKVAKIIGAGSDYERKEINAMVIARSGRNATPEKMLATLKGLVVNCKRCAGTGRYQKGKGGPCYRCSGAGSQTLDDARRNHAYDVQAIREACGF
jgi:DnaJ-class molecular chaperone